MDPQVRYCTSSDGLSIGYWSIGRGETVIEPDRNGPPHGEGVEPRVVDQIAPGAHGRDPCLP